MHESSLIANLLKKIETIALQQDAVRVTGVTVSLGALSHISAEHFREHFQNETIDSIAADAELDIELGEDIDDPNAQDVLLKSVNIEK